MHLKPQDFEMVRNGWLSHKMWSKIFPFYNSAMSYFFLEYEPVIRFILFETGCFVLSRDPFVPAFVDSFSGEFLAESSCSFHMKFLPSEKSSENFSSSLVFVVRIFYCHLVFFCAALFISLLMLFSKIFATRLSFIFGQHFLPSAKSN